MARKADNSPRHDPLACDRRNRAIDKRRPIALGKFVRDKGCQLRSAVSRTWISRHLDFRAKAPMLNYWRPSLFSSPAFRQSLPRPRRRWWHDLTPAGAGSRRRSRKNRGAH